MLKNITVDPQLPYSKVVCIEKGIYSTYNIQLCATEKLIKFPIETENQRIYDEYCTFKNCNFDVSDFGVSDNIDQVKEYYQDQINDPDKLYLIVCNEQFRDDSGWRWHKEGKYIGMKNRYCECFADEPEIESVFLFSLYEFE